jgi:Rad3-related DNA helicase
MGEEERENFLKHFTGNEYLNIQENIRMTVELEEKSLLGFCVLGGIFGEGIDLKHDSLIGVIVVGTGLPQVCAEREILKGYFDGRGENGFDYAYRYPGMNKVMQAAGRVIRTDQDVGIVALLDERFLQTSYTRLFPREWKEYRIVEERSVDGQVEKFWNKWL